MPPRMARPSGMQSTLAQSLRTLTLPAVLVRLDDVSPTSHGDSHSKLSHRIVTLNEENAWSVRVGRATSTPSGPDEEEGNALFRSRVVSREHAYISANPSSGKLTIEDAGSMHGTHTHGQRLVPDRPRVMEQHDVVLFGTAVERGERKSSVSPSEFQGLPCEDTFHPIVQSITWEWKDDAYVPPPSDLTQFNETRHRSPDMPLSNTFMVPEYSDEEEEDEDEDQPYQTGMSPPRDHPRAYSVPDSVSVISSNVSISDGDSPSSSPFAPYDDADVSGKPADVTGTANIVGSTQSEGRQREEGATHEELSNHPRITLNTENVMGEKPLSLFSDSMKQRRQSPDSTGSYEISDDDSRQEEFDEFDESDEFEDEELSVPANTRSTLELPLAQPLQRDPSPSDAAMVKPVVDSVRGPPFEPVASPTAASSIKPELETRSDNAWAGHNAVLYDPSMPLMTPVYDPYPYPMAAPSMINPHAVPQWNPMLNSYYQQQPHEAMPFAQDQRSWLPQVDRKRKADEMSKDEEAEFRGSASALRPEPPTVTPTRMVQERYSATSDGTIVHVGTTNVPVLTVSSVADLIKSPTPAAAEPTRKKQKRSERDSGRRTVQGSSYAKFAVTALAGAAVGAVGAVLGLAALPQDFFV